MAIQKAAIVTSGGRVKHTPAIAAPKDKEKDKDKDGEERKEKGPGAGADDSSKQ